ncbi:MAG: response regulator, partial [Planctomycetota bacterium]
PGSNAPGTGLGLAICKRIIEALGGTMSCDSNPGVETCFTCLVPLKPYGSDRIQPGPIDERHKPTRSSPLGRKSLAGVRVLLAEDSVHVRDVLRYFVVDMGASIEHVGTGREAVETIRSRASEFDVVLMDMQMPEMDGYAAATQLKNAGISIPIIALTAHGLAEDREKCLDAGCDDYLSKPVSPDHLAVTIQRLLDSTSIEVETHPDSETITSAKSAPSELIVRYLKHLQSQASDFRVLQREHAQLRKQMHQIKGTAATMGLVAISHAAADVEQAIKLENGDQRINELLERLIALIDQ